MPQRQWESMQRGALKAGLLALVFFLAPASRAAAARFIGSASCRVCHESAFAQWQASPHAKAVDSLPRESQKDPRCLECHSRDVSNGGDPAVTCETCHGAGQYYWPEYVMRDSEVSRAAGLVAVPDAKACMICHDGSSPSLRPFDPRAAMAAIDHWSKERAIRKAKYGQSCPRKDGSPAVREAARQAPPGEGFLGRVLTGRWTVPAAVPARPPAPRRGAGKGWQASAGRSPAAAARAD